MKTAWYLAFMAPLFAFASGALLAGGTWDAYFLSGLFGGFAALAVAAVWALNQEG